MARRLLRDVLQQQAVLMCLGCALLLCGCLLTDTHQALLAPMLLKGIPPGIWPAIYCRAGGQAAGHPVTNSSRAAAAPARLLSAVRGSTDSREIVNTHLHVSKHLRRSHALHLRSVSSCVPEMIQGGCLKRLWAPDRRCWLCPWCFILVVGVGAYNP